MSRPLRRPVYPVAAARLTGLHAGAAWFRGPFATQFLVTGMHGLQIRHLEAAGLAVGLSKDRSFGGPVAPRLSGGRAHALGAGQSEFLLQFVEPVFELDVAHATVDQP